MDRLEAETYCQAVFMPDAPHPDLSACIERIESALIELPTTIFHCVIGKEFLPLSNKLADYMLSYYGECATQGEVKSIYFEMNGFSHNTNYWFCNGFALSDYQGADDGYQWLAEFGIGGDGDYFGLTTEDPHWTKRIGKKVQRDRDRPNLTSMDEVRLIYETFAYPDGDNYERGKTDNEETASALSDYLIIARFNQLVAAAHSKAAQRAKHFVGLPILCTSHDSPDWTICETRQ